MGIRIASRAVLLDGRLQPAVLAVEGGMVRHVQRPGDAPEPDGGDGPLVDLGDTPLCPEPVDLHFHGAGGVSVPPGGAPRTLDDAVEGILTAGGWSLGAVGLPPIVWEQLTPVPLRYLATLPIPTDPPADIVEHVTAAARAYADAGPGRCAGLRIEGLFLNRARAGVWPLATFRAPDVGLLEQLVTACDEAGCPLRVLDVAPELDGAEELIARAVELGVVVAMAHTDATWREAQRGMDAGATLATHLFNAMRPFHHREPGAVAAAMVDPRVTCELICDGVHVHPGAIALAAAAGRIAAVSDASPFAGAGAGEFDWLGMRIHGDGTTLHDDAGNLAGAARLLDAAGPVLATAGLNLTARLVAMAAEPLRVLDAARPLGLAAGDTLWIPGPAALHS
jgi:N-acetylglucosamine-6-phosphate deacetylase